jgi:hypothetical protein
MAIKESKGAGGETEYEVEFREHRLEDIVVRLNRFERADERPFEAVAEISEFNQRAYELFLRPLVQATSNEYTAKLGRQFHPLRFQRWSISDLNPWLAWLGPAAEMVKAQRQPTGEDEPLRKTEALGAELMSASLDYYRAVRDAASEAAFFSIYASMFQFHMKEKFEAEESAQAPPADIRENPFVQEALANIARGGYNEAFARLAYLLARRGEPLPLSRLTMRQDLAKDYASLVPDMPLDEWRRVRGEQEVIARYAPDEAIATLPQLLEEDDRQRLLTLIERLLADHRVQESKPTAEQLAMVERVRKALNGGVPESARARRAAPASPGRKPA